MARADTYTLLSLDRYAEIMGIDPLHFNQVESDLTPVTNACDDLWLQHNWQTAGRISREAIAIAIQEAEKRITDFIGYPPAPRWIVDEAKKTVVPSRRELVSTRGYNVRGLRKSVTLKNKYVISGGVEDTDDIELGAAVAFSDSTSDGYEDTATVEATVDEGTDPCELGIYYPDKSGDKVWEIRPASVTVVGTTATIVAQKCQMVLENLLEQLGTADDDQVRAIDGDDNTNFLQTVDVYRRFNDPSQQVTFTWERPTQYADTTQTGFIKIRDDRRGIVAYTPGTWDEDDLEFDVACYTLNYEPDSIHIWYRAGWQDQDRSCPNSQMAPSFEVMIARYANTLIESEMCGCANFKTQVDYWRDDFTLVTRERRHLVTARQLENPFGPTRAGVYVWETLRKGNFVVGESAGS